MVGLLRVCRELVSGWLTEGVQGTSECWLTEGMQGTSEWLAY